MKRVRTKNQTRARNLNHALTVFSVDVYCVVFSFISVAHLLMLAFSALTLLAGLQEERGADCLHMVQLMPLHPQTPPPLASFKSRLVLPFCYQLSQIVPEKRAITWV